jgi:D-serine deaminase-like pyridoxal phosphate-dependent protein
MHAAFVGMSREEIDSPALLLDLDKLEANIARMAEFFADKPAGLRPHTKTHKCPPIAHKQIESGAIGVTCAKLDEAVTMAQAGIRDILIANQIVGRRKIERLMGLAGWTQIMVAVDDARNVDDLSAAATSRGVSLRVLVEVDVGMGRCGVHPGDPAVALARQVTTSPGLIFEGVMGYEGHAVMRPTLEERRERAEASMALLTGTKDQVEAAGMEVRIVSGGGTGTHNISGAYPGVTEIQAGSYATMDVRYRNCGLLFECALTCLTTVISVPRAGIAITDTGMKAITPEFGMPEVVGREGLCVTRLSEEHGYLEIVDGVSLCPGDKIELIPSHGCTTINLHDHYYALRQGTVEAIWPIGARGGFR